MAVRVLAWNCRGQASATRRRSLIDIVREEKPKILFLCETLCNDRQHETLRMALGFDNCFSVSKRERQGENCRGLAMLWDNDTPLRIHKFSLRHIDAFVGPPNSPDEWRLTGFYGYPHPQEHHRSWDLLREIHVQASLPWLVTGDFNAIMEQKEKSGGDPKPWNQIHAFRQALQDCDLMDMGYEGHDFTWDCVHTKERLDRSVWNAALQALFPVSTNHHLKPFGSDHRPLLVNLGKIAADTRAPPKRLFRFEKMWASHPDCEQVVTNAWHRPLQGNFVLQACSRIKSVSAQLLKWQKEAFQQNRIEMQAIRSRLDVLLSSPFDASQNAEKKELDARLQTLLTMEEAKWSQRSRTLWLKEGDRNTSFFQARASGRKHRNRIDQLKNNQGAMVTSPTGIEKIVTDYFTNIFTSNGVHDQACNIILDTVEPRVTPHMNHQLLLPYTNKEIKEALFLMHPSKSPGPDGMSPFFFQKHWHVLGLDICEAVRLFLTDKHFMQSVNYTYVTLIPKIKDAKEMGDLRPIALCNILYKIGSKVLANRLKKILHDIISPLQSAYVPGRLISDNTLIATEVAHQMHINDRVGNGEFALKLDISKAYDRLEWGYMTKLLLKLGFSPEWVDMVMASLTSVRYSYLINGRVCGYLTPARGIRQGDPLSPYLFILCAEGLSCLISHYVSQGWIKGMSLTASAPILHHLLFADDSYLFGTATDTECQHIRNILHTYEVASGQMVNLQKSSVVFSHNVQYSKRCYLANLLGVQCVTQHDRYLGLPTRVGRSRVETFEFLRDKMMKKLTGWRKKLLSCAGKEVMIKALAQTVPTYTMNCYLLPITLCDELHQVCADYWWGDTTDKQKIHWRSWNRLCLPKDQGGLGFKHLHWWNLALLAYQGWRIIQNPNSLVSRLYKALYFPHTDFMHANYGRRPSFSFRSLLDARSILQAGQLNKIGNGTNINIWHDPWIPGRYARCPYSPKPANAPETVAELIDQENHAWKIDKLRQYFLDADVEAILNIHIPSHSGADKLIWNRHPKKIFTSNSAYIVARELSLGDSGSTTPPPSEFSPLWKKIWKSKVPPKVSMCTWRACSDNLPNRSRIATKGYTGDQDCLFCTGHQETNYHLFVECPKMQEACSAAGIIIPPLSNINRFDRWLLYQSAELPRAQFDKLLSLLWSMWRNRNSQMWEGKCNHPADVSLMACNWLAEYQKHNPYKQKPSSRNKLWKRPGDGTIKCNFAGVSNYARSQSGFAYLLRDSHASALQCVAIPIGGAMSPFHVTLSALKHAMDVAVAQCLPKVHFETTCLQLLRLLKCPNSDASPTGILLSNIQGILRQNPGFSIAPVHYMANTPAYQLARHALTSSHSFSWCNTAPEIIRDAILNDCNRS